MSDAAPSATVPDTLPQSRAPRARVSSAPARRQPTYISGAALLASLDSLAAVAAILGVLISVSWPTLPGGLDGFLSARVTVKNVLLLIFLGTAWPMVFHAFGLYEFRRVRPIGSETWRLVAAVTVGSALALVFPLTSVTGSLTVADLRHFWLTSLVLSLLVRSGRRGMDRVRQRHARRALIIGAGPLAGRASRDIHADRLHRYDLVGFVDEPADSALPFERVPDQMIGTLEELEQILMREVIDEVVIALPVKSCYEQIQYVLGVCEQAGVHAKYAADMFESTVAFPRYDARHNRAFVAMHVAPDGYRLVVKRAIDVICAFAILVVLTPLLLIAAVLVKLTSRGPILYAQARCGLNKRPFRMYKFRSMSNDADSLQASLEARNEARGPVFKISDDPRITRVGRLLRKSSFDELPQLWNVVLGDMSLVGPRPLPGRDVNRITRPSDMRRFSMRPGLTCLWQVQGRNNLDFDRWVELDLEYIDTWSLTLDLWILLKTIPAVLSGNGAT